MGGTFLENHRGFLHNVAVHLHGRFRLGEFQALVMNGGCFQRDAVRCGSYGCAWSMVRYRQPANWCCLPDGLLGHEKIVGHAAIKCQCAMDDACRYVAAWE